jgi:uncharacterized protein
VRGAACLLALALATGCSADGPESPDAAVTPGDERVSAVLDGVALTLEVADTAEERAVGLMRRESVPPGTGMVFRYDEPSTGRYYMYDVPVPLRAVFVRDGEVVSTVVMPPCGLDDPAACPTYGADGPWG